MDLEMTGLDPAKHVIVEIATLLTDDELNIIAEGPDLVIHATEDQLAEMDQVVVDMHTRSGLLDQIRSSTTTLEDAGSRTLAFLREHIEAPRSVPLCGNSIGMDRRFLAAYLNDIEEFLHYRSIDVSTIKELARRWYPESLSSAPRKDAGHRALDDITESVNELRYYRQAVFRSPDRDGASEATGTATSRGASEATGTATSRGAREAAGTATSRGAGEATAIEGTAVSGASGAGTSPGTSAESSA